MKRSQNSGNNSISVISDGHVNIHTGVSVSDVKEICRDLMKETLSGFSQEAQKEAERRNEKIIEDFIERAEALFGDKVEEKLSSFKDPGAQYAFRHAQTGYCRYGDSESKDDAIEIILSRISENNDHAINVIFDEAIERSAKINSRHADILTIIFAAFRISYGHINNIAALNSYISMVEKLSSTLPARNSDMSILSMNGLIEVMPNTQHWVSFERMLLNEYWGLFIKGFSVSEIEADFDFNDRDLIIPCLRDASKLQPNHVKRQGWRNKLTSRGRSEVYADELCAKMDSFLMSEEEISRLLDDKWPMLSRLRGAISDEMSSFRYSTVTSVGSIIAYVRAKRSGFQLGEDVRRYIDL
ncbi:LPO_1073/Vpar_1526 family protein [Caulobacter radicis]|uniref:LPO_1073/Vpar_1526 family protein n=1 Tax=Caulobacter radicis TaxID=2172650 RepID=UPI0010576E86|nr:LPO_1073/Vpar_1526 family protein [Caulobacter radicis]